MRGGKFIGDIPTHYLPPGIPGFEEAGGLKGPGYDFLNNPRGNMALAQEYMKKAGYPSGKYTGTKTLLMVGRQRRPGQGPGTGRAAQIEKLGSRSSSALSRRTRCTTSSARSRPRRSASAATAGWFKDFIDPQSMLEVTFKGAAIVTNGAGTTTWRSSTTRRSTPRWTRRHGSPARADQGLGRHRQDDHGPAPAVPSCGTRPR